MDEKKEQQPPSEEKQPPKFWVDPNYQSKIAWRDDDVVVSVPPKSGTTWAMNIVHQLREKGDRNFEDILAEVTWIEVMDFYSSTEEDMVNKLDNMDNSLPRVLKTHSAPPVLPYNDKVKYVVVARNPEEAIFSMKKFIDAHSDDFLKYWGREPGSMKHPDLQSYYDNFIKGSGIDKRIFGFVSEWWKLRGKENVLMLHYSEMVKDHEGSIKKISDFLGYGPYTDEEWQTVLELTSFQWMKRHESRFEARTVWEVPPLVPGGMMRQGSSGLARKEGISDDIANDLRERGREVLKDDVAFEWLYNGGEL